MPFSLLIKVSSVSPDLPCKLACFKGCPDPVLRPRLEASQSPFVRRHLLFSASVLGPLFTGPHRPVPDQVPDHSGRPRAPDCPHYPLDREPMKTNWLTRLVKHKLSPSAPACYCPRVHRPGWPCGAAFPRFKLKSGPDARSWLLPYRWLQPGAAEPRLEALRGRPGPEKPAPRAGGRRSVHQGALQARAAAFLLAEARAGRTAPRPAGASARRGFGGSAPLGGSDPGAETPRPGGRRERRCQPCRCPRPRRLQLSPLWVPVSPSVK